MSGARAATPPSSLAASQQPGYPAALDEATRVRLGAGVTTQAEVLLRLAFDPSVTVRTALALNPSAPPAALKLLARDVDERVRTLLARKLATLTPGLSDVEHTRLHLHTIEALGLLVQDEAVRVRAAIAEVVKDMPDIPRELVLRLARDTAIQVSGPVIRLSPLLTQADLLALLAAPNADEVAQAMARRPGLVAEVADAIAAGASSAAIRALLLNRSAQIRKSTLDSLIARAGEHVEWHAPLVRRPRLTASGALALSRIIADTLLSELANRADLPHAVTAELRTRLSAHLAQAAGANQAQAKPGMPPPHDPSWNNLSVTTANQTAGSSETAGSNETAGPTVGAQRPASSGKLTEDDLLVTARRGEAALAAAMLAMAAGVPLALVQRAAALRSAKGLISLVWKAGFSMRLAVPLQILLGQLSPAGVLSAGPGGTFPLAIEEMRWQIAFLGGKQD